MYLTVERIKKIANDLMFDMTSEQYIQVQKDFELILKQMSLLNDIPNIDHIEPMTFPYEQQTDYMADDEVCEVLDVDEVLRNAKKIKENQISVPKVV